MRSRGRAGLSTGSGVKFVYLLLDVKREVLLSRSYGSVLGLGLGLVFVWLALVFVIHSLNVDRKLN